MRVELLNTAADLLWLKQTHLRGIWTPTFRSAMIYGNEDAPSKLVLYHSSDPEVNDKPVMTLELHPELTDAHREQIRWQAVQYVAELLNADAEFLRSLVNTRVPCPEVLAATDHDIIAFPGKTGLEVGPLGFLNGFLRRLEVPPVVVCESTESEIIGVTTAATVDPAPVEDVNVEDVDAQD